MAVDTKELIAQAAGRLLLEKKKLTVKDIVDECHITRQSFYYHFEDVPHLLEWMLERIFNDLKEEAGKQSDGEAALKYLIMAALSLKPYFDRTMKTSYADELGMLVRANLRSMFDAIADSRGAVTERDREKMRVVIRYHTHALIGYIGEWTPEDTKNIDGIVHTIYTMMSDDIGRI